MASPIPSTDFNSTLRIQVSIDTNVPIFGEYPTFGPIRLMSSSLFFDQPTSGRSAIPEIPVAIAAVPFRKLRRPNKCFDKAVAQTSILELTMKDPAPSIPCAFSANGRRVYRQLPNEATPTPANPPPSGTAENVPLREHNLLALTCSPRLILSPHALQ